MKKLNAITLAGFALCGVLLGMKALDLAEAGITLLLMVWAATPTAQLPHAPRWCCTPCLARRLALALPCTSCTARTSSTSAAQSGSRPPSRPPTRERQGNMDDLKELRALRDRLLQSIGWYTGKAENGSTEVKTDDVICRLRWVLNGEEPRQGA